MYKYCASLALLLLFYSSTTQASANDHFYDTLSLADAFTLTLENHPTLKASTSRKDSLLEKKQSLSLRPSYSLTVETDNLSNSKNDQSTENSLSLSSFLELGNKRSARKYFGDVSIAKFEAESELQALDLLGDVSRDFMAVVAAQERVKLSEQALALSTTTFQEVEKRVNAGATPKAEIQRAKARLANAKLTLVSERKQLDFLKSHLAFYWGAREANFDVANGDLFIFGSDIELNELFENLDDNPATQFYAEQARLMKAQLRLAKAESNLNLQWSVGVSQFKADDSTAFKAGISLPLFSGRRNQNNIKSLNAESDAVNFETANNTTELYSALNRAYHQRQLAIAKVNSLSTEIIPALTLALKQTQTAYQTGRYSYMDYSSANQELILAKQNRIASALAAQQLASEIEQMSAQSLSDFESSSLTN